MLLLKKRKHVAVCPLTLQGDKTCNNSLNSSCENSFRMASSLPLVSQRPLFVYWFIFHCERCSIETPCSSVIQYPLCMWRIVYCPVCALQDFPDLDGVVQQRRQEMMESSSSGSQTPDYDKIPGMFSVLSRRQPLASFLPIGGS